jgi:site-specific DNA-cytosine methylase
MKVLVACEESQVVCNAFRARGHEAYSCDIVPTTGKNKWWHFQRSIFDVLALTKGWDMMIAFPPCTHLSVSGARWFKEKEIEQKEAIRFFMKLVNADIPKIAIENPVGIMSTTYRKPDQIIQPWQFGHGETKATCLWLKNLPKLVPTNIVEGREHRVHKMAPGPNRARDRAVTFQGIAEAMAEQWGMQQEHP